MNNYTHLLVKQLFLELFCATRTGVADPTIQHRGGSAFIVIEEGEHEEETGLWVANEETREEGLRCKPTAFTAFVVQGRIFKKDASEGKGSGKKGKKK